MVEQRLSYRDIGRLMGVSKQAAHRRLRRAVDAIREYEARVAAGGSIHLLCAEHAKAACKERP